jgi:hypothetical protein
MARPRTDVTIDSLLDRYINPVVERQKEREAAHTQSAPSEAVQEGVSHSGIPESSIPESGIPESSIPESGILETGIPESTTPVTVPMELPTRSWVKAANWLFDKLPAHITGTPWIVYMHLYRIAVGFNHGTSCRIGYGGLAKRTAISRTAIVNAVAELRAAGLVDVGDTTQEGTLFTLKVPADIVDSGILESGIPESGILKSDIPGVPESSIPENDTPTKRQRNAGVSESGIPENDTNKDKGTSTKDNNRQDVVAVLERAGYKVDPVKVAAWIARGVTAEKVQGYIDYIRRQKGKISNPTGWLITAVESGWVVEGAASQVAAGRDVTEQVDTEEQIRELERQRLAELMAELGPEHLDAMRQEEREKCKHDPGYHNQPNERMREHYIEALLRMRLLAGT